MAVMRKVCGVFFETSLLRSESKLRPKTLTKSVVDPIGLCNWPAVGRPFLWQKMAVRSGGAWSAYT